MIPQFPEFKKIEITDQEEVTNFTKNYPVYSDFNFISLFCWDTDDRRQFSMLNNNLVVRLTDDISGKEFFSFLGNNQVPETIRSIFKYAKKQNIRPILRMIPQETINFCSAEELRVEIKEDRDNFDYVYSVNEIASLEGGKYSRQRRLAKRFESQYGDSCEVKVVELNDSAELSVITNVWEKWNSVRESYSKREEKALLKLLKYVDNFNLISIVVFVQEKPIAFMIAQICNESTAVSHFGKADYHFTGVFSFLMREASKKLRERNCDLLNLEEDLGLGQIRLMKEQYRPISFMRKYSLEQKTGVLQWLKSMIQY
jgi:hypothetical protein